MTKEEDYIEALSEPKTTKELMGQFNATNAAVLQVLRTLRLRRLVRKDGEQWKTVSPDDPIEYVSLTELQVDHLEYLETPHYTTEVMDKTGRKMCAVQQVIRTLTLGGMVERIGRDGVKGGGCKYVWQTTPIGMEAIADYHSGD